MTTAADFRIFQALFGTLNAAEFTDVVGIMAVITGGVGAGLIQLAWLGMNRLHEVIDLLINDLETLMLLIWIVLVLFPGLLMTIDTADDDLRRFSVRNTVDGDVTTVAALLTMHARLNLLAMYENFDCAAIIAHIGFFFLIAVTGQATFIGNDALTGLWIKIVNHQLTR